MNVSFDRRGGIAILTIDRPPVNALSQDLRALIDARLQEVEADETITGLVLACAGRTFVAGAEITEVGKLMPPMLRDVIDRIERLNRPSIAALHGTTLGGGLELSLGCTFRIAAPDTRLGLPEVKLGFLPGAGGTVRGSYLAGAEAILRLAGSGDMISADQAMSQGLIDAIAQGDLIEDAIGFLMAKIAAGDSPLPVSQRRDTMPPATPEQLTKIEAALCRKARSSAPSLVAIAAGNALAMPFADAMREERALFDTAVDSLRSAALRHLFFAERLAAKPTGPAATVTPRDVQSVGVIGAGTMGGGIAMTFANAGFDVMIRETNQQALDVGLARIRANYVGSVQRGSIPQSEADRRIGRITGTILVSDLAQSDLIVEAAFEDIEVKRSIFAELDAIARPGAILATNTSYLDVNAIAGFTNRSGDVLGLHFFSPANVMKLLEVVQGADTAPDVVATALKVARRLGKQSVVVGVCHGFVGNRMLAARNAQLSHLMLEGALPAQIDAAFRALGWPMGPCEMQDLAGLDISWRNRKALGRVDALPDHLCGLGRFGQKTGSGWYSYHAGDRTPHPDPAVELIVTKLAADAGITRRNLSDAEIIDRTHGPMIAEGRSILRDGIAARASDIDVIWVQGYGFPRDLGGPMFWDDHGRPPAP
ncbi:3-hydroxyacyl-CoA dehydrogenase NAD-binding domain-containing protein [Puniceibacterium sp. IMCC21224]|uniref:3-hydroxyacyl-CoA dehydrogenase NAD-binding domain-containing protein n=1 Tax=Puniceibacterium sp. IMCC21224 TaxID=1618204 RepID=UPI00064E0979|nr:3-hydroxyacyl-CoA dehydrogenase NAD-binding domain-containing protein [Puniceibacterium sp. IMCC21224]KMK66408.1 3-hydroxyacyl-CoA dehydrogenase [Puniceibacterium sp. IMCC21224]